MREFRFESQGVPLFAYEDGSGPPLVMLHGAMSNHQAALSFAAPLADRCRIVVPDVRGNGKARFGGELSFDRQADDVAGLLDHLEVDRAVVGGVSSGSGVALRFALRYPSRTLGLILIKPVYGGELRGYTEQQQQTFSMMDAVASRALDEGVQVLRPLYASLPQGVRERALALLESFDPASVVTTSRFVASGRQPFGSPAELTSLQVPTLLVRGDDPIHPAEVSDIYAANIPHCTIVSAADDIGAAIATFVEQHGSSKELHVMTPPL